MSKKKTNISLSLKVRVFPRNFTMVGEILTYIYTVTNIDLFPLSGSLIINDCKIGRKKIVTVTLDPKQSRQVTAKYRVTNEDLEKGSINTEVTAFIENKGWHFMSGPVTNCIKSEGFIFLQAPNDTVSVTNGTSHIVTIKATPGSQFTINSPNMIIEYVTGNNYVLRLLPEAKLPDISIVVISSGNITRNLCIKNISSPPVQEQLSSPSENVVEKLRHPSKVAAQLTGIGIQNNGDDNSTIGDEGIVGTLVPIYGSGKPDTEVITYLVDNDDFCLTDNILKYIGTGSPDTTLLTIRAKGLSQPVIITPNFPLSIITFSVFEGLPQAMVATVSESEGVEVGPSSLVKLEDNDIKLVSSVTWRPGSNIECWIKYKGLIRNIITPVVSIAVRPIAIDISSPIGVSLGHIQFKGKQYPLINSIDLDTIASLVTPIYPDEAVGDRVLISQVIPTVFLNGYDPTARTITYSSEGDYILPVDIYSNYELLLSNVDIPIKVTK